MNATKIADKFLKLFYISVLMLTAAAGNGQQVTVAGKIDAVYVTASTISDFRVSVHVAPMTTASVACSGAGPGWYSLERQNVTLKKAMLASILSARATQATVSITGTGTCDDYSLESVFNFIY